jgi:hypothetical protein
MKYIGGCLRYDMIRNDRGKRRWQSEARSKACVDARELGLFAAGGTLLADRGTAWMELPESLSEVWQEWQEGRDS